MSKVQEAIALIAQEGISVYAAAKRLGVPATSVYSAIQRSELKKLKGIVECPTCGSSVPADRIKR